MSEVNKNGQLAGMDKAMEMTAHAQFAQIAAALEQIAKVSVKQPSYGSREAFFKDIKALKPQTQKDIYDGVLQVNDVEILGTAAIPVAAGENTVEVFKDADVIVVGQKSLTSGKLEEEANMVLYELEITAATIVQAGATATSAELALADWDGLDTIPGLINGVLTLKVGEKIILKQISLKNFSKKDSIEFKNSMILANPKMFLGGKKISAKLEFMSTANVPAKTHIRLALKGSGTNPNLA